MKKLLAILMALALMAALFAGCASKTQAPDEVSAPDESAPGEDAPPAEAPAVDVGEVGTSTDHDIMTAGEAADAHEATHAIAYPLDAEGITLTVFTNQPALGPLTGRIPIESHGEYETWKYSLECTGIDIDLTETSMMTSTEQFNLMVASGEYADMITGAESQYSGGLTKAFDDEVIIDLAELVEENCPDYWRYIAADEHLARDTRDDSGRIYGVYSIYDSAIYIEGYLMRGDWLDKLALKAPTDFDQLTEVFTAFKNEIGCEYPAFVNKTTIFMNHGYDLAGFDVASGGLPMTVDGVNVKCDFQQDAYRDWLEMMNDWYNKGLIDPNFMEVSNDMFSGETERLNLLDQVGSFTQMSTSLSTFYENETPGYSLVPVVVTADGSGINHMLSDTLVFSSTVISTRCEYPELALQYMNWWYTDEGQMCYNYGMEGTHYTISEDGEVEFTDLVINNDLGVSPTLYMRTFTIAGFGWGRTIQSRNWCFYEDYAAEAVNFWTEHNDGAYALPTLSFTTEESERIAQFSADVCTYVAERIPQYITGDLAFDTWDAFVQELEQFNLSELVSIYQAAYDRYLSR